MRGSGKTLMLVLLAYTEFLSGKKAEDQASNVSFTIA